jgi:hypothetical protein
MTMTVGIDFYPTLRSFTQAVGQLGPTLGPSAPQKTSKRWHIYCHFPICQRQTRSWHFAEVLTTG